MKTSITCVTVDCANPRLVADFWNAALLWGGVEYDEGGGAICGPPRGGIYLEFVPVPEAKEIKNRLHLGCSAGSLAGLDAELDRLLALGAAPTAVRRPCRPAPGCTLHLVESRRRRRSRSRCHWHIC